MHSIIVTHADGILRTDVDAKDVPRWLEDNDAHVWVDIQSPVDDTDLHLLRDVFKFHPVALEDCLAAREQPKVDNFDRYLYVITHGLLLGSTAEDAQTLELDAFLGKRFLVTFHEQVSRSVIGARDMLMRDGAMLLRRSPTLLLHSILDFQLEFIEEVVDGIESQLEELESRVFAKPESFDLEGLLALKRNTLRLRRWMSKQREVMLRLARQEFGLVGSNEAVLFRDLFDHFSRITDLLENFREMAISILDVYLASTNNRLNETMKFLTLFTALLMPLTVITGIYGMNFHHMPELEARWGYPIVLAVMASTSWLVYRFFRKRGWFSNDLQLPAATPRPARTLPPGAPTLAPTTHTARVRRTSQIALEVTAQKR